MSASAILRTPISEIATKVEASRKYFRAGKTLSISSRLESLHKIVRMMDENKEKFLAALDADFKKPRTEATLMEVDMVKNETWLMISHLREWTSPEHVAREGIQYLDTAYTLADPLGVVLVIAPWNYPIQLMMVPIVGAIAAGNTVVLKPSELAQNTARVLTEALEATFPPELVCIVNGAAEETTEALAQRYDHIFYTGNSRVAKFVSVAAAKHLTPVTLELGGKSPVYVDASANIPAAARRIIWGRCVNAGQTCIAPDYVLAHPSIKDELLLEMKSAVGSLYGANPKNSPDFARIVSDAHFKRIADLIHTSGGKVAIGGDTDASQRYISPTVIVDPKLDSTAMTDEIFGPVLPLLTIANVDAAIEFINDREKPLAMYIFTQDASVSEALQRRTTCGGITVNDCIMHASVDTLPFGGCGMSGCGAYHGKRTFETFAHKKAVLVRAAGLEFANDIRYPPYTERKLGLLQTLLNRNGPKSNSLLYFAVGAVIACAVAIYWQYYRRRPGVVV